MDDKIIEVLLEIKKKYGNEVFKDSKKLMNLLKDLLEKEYGKCRGRITAIMTALDERAYETLIQYYDSPVKVQERYLNSLKQTYNDATAVFAVNALSAIVGVPPIHLRQIQTTISIPIANPIPAPAQTTTSLDFDCKINTDGGMIITKYKGKDKNVGIPNTINGKKVTSIGDFAFKGCNSLTGVTIPNSITSIGREAFEDCSSLTGVMIPKGVTYIGIATFKGCSKLTSVTLPNSVTHIGIFAFKGCSSLTSVTIPNGVTYIGLGAFADCSSLTGVMIPNSVTYIGLSVFGGCSSLTSVTIPNSVTHIDCWEFITGGNIRVICASGSYAHNYCVKKNINFELN